MTNSVNGAGSVGGDDEAQDVEQRRANRLAKDLGINPAGVEVILHLRRQVIALQGRVRQLEGTLTIERTHTSTWLAQYRHEYDEAIWEDTL